MTSPLPPAVGSLKVRPLLLLLALNAPLQIYANPFQPQVALGPKHSCSITQEGDVVCWGSQMNGRLGNGQSNLGVSLPTTVLGLEGSALTVAVGEESSCAITDAKKLYCWGRIAKNSAQKTNFIAATNIRLPEGVTPLQVATGLEHTCVVAEEGSLWCMGSNSNGKLGNPRVAIQATAPRPLRVAPFGDTIKAQFVSVADSHTCVVTHNAEAQKPEIYCMGYGFMGVLGNFQAGVHSQIIPKPTKVLPPGQKPISLATGLHHTCTVTEEDKGSLCWGDGSLGKLADNNTFQHANIKGHRNSRHDLALVAAAKNYSCGVTKDEKEIWCWGKVEGLPMAEASSSQSGSYGKPGLAYRLRQKLNLQGSNALSFLMHNSPLYLQKKT